jgi:hypothetical protein
MKIVLYEKYDKTKAGLAKLADAEYSKSLLERACRFDSGNQIFSTVCELFLEK